MKFTEIFFKKKKKNLDGEAGIVVDIMIKQFDDLNENIKMLLIYKLIDFENRLSDLENEEIKIIRGGR